MDDTPERSGDRPEDHAMDALPAPLSSWRPAKSAPGGGPPQNWEESALDSGEPTAARPITVGLVWRAVRRHWWRIALLWIVVTAGLETLVHYRVKPSYEATAWVKVEPTSRSLLTEKNASTSDFGPYLKTQVLLISSPDVLKAALLDPGVAALPSIAGSLDPEVDLRARLDVNIQRDTHIIWVRMSSRNPTEGPTVVNAVVDAYLKAARGWSDEEMASQLERLGELRKKFRNEVERLEQELERLSREEGSVKELIDNKNLATLDEFRAMREQRTRVQMDLYTAESQLDYLQKSLARQKALVQASRPQVGAADLDARVEQVFRRQPEAAALIDQLGELKQRIGRAERLARTPANDPAVRALRQEHRRIEEEYQRLWKELYPSLRNLAQQAPSEDQALSKDLENELRQWELEVNRLRNEDELLGKRLETLEVESQRTGDRALRIKFLVDNRAHNQEMLEKVEAHISQIEFERYSNSSITVIARARPVGQMMGSNRLKLMAAAPVGALGLLLGLFTLLELRAARVSDPDDLPTRVHLGVLGVVPPLPALTGSRGLRRRGDDRRRVEEFVQSLDHLRVALCAGAADGEPNRSILITSAIGGEGKTTLAAQLAGRCANAGLLTLLVDADLRRPSLGDLLEVPEGPGLADVLAGEAAPEQAMVVIGNAGGFHLLPAGATGRDPSRLLHGEPLGHLIARLRSTFDIVIVDAPPVLAVPDALLLGRWTDGAVLAVRHDTSRFPLVERAHRRLASVGIPVLGAVVNGCRTLDNSYGAYHYNPYAYSSTEREEG